MKHRQLFSATGLALTALFLLVAVAIISSLPRLRIDLTADRLYTLAEGTRSIVRNLEQPVDVIFFYSDAATTDVPQVRAYGTRVQELLREMAIAGGGNVNFQVIDPQPFSVEEDQATEYGIRAVPLAAGGEEVYFGLVVRDANNHEIFETMPLIRPDQEEFLEYEFSRLITRVAEPDPIVVGFISGLHIDGGIAPGTRQPTAPWAFMESIRYLYETRRLNNNAIEIEDDIDILMLVHPQDLSAETLYAIDQYVMRGGRVIAFVDPNADTQTQQLLSTGDGPQSLASDLGVLFESWGIEYDPGLVVTDRDQAMFVTVGQSQRPISHIGMLGIQRPGFTNDIVTGRLEVMNLSSAGALAPREGASTTFEPLIRSSANSMLMDGVYFRELTDPTILLDEFSADSNHYVMAARVSGPARSAFPDGSPFDPEAPRGLGLNIGEDGQAVVEDPIELHAALPPAISESQRDISVIVVADTDLLADRMWARQQNIMGQRITQAFANNSDFVINALDNLAGSQELISIRGRGRYARPFTRVIDLQRAADERLREEETNLLRSLSQTEQQIAALSQEGDGAGGLTPQIEAEIERSMQQQLETRRQLRNVQHQLNRDIEALGSRLKLINTALVPTVLVIMALLIGYLRRRRHSTPVSSTGS